MKYYEETYKDYTEVVTNELNYLLEGEYSRALIRKDVEASIFWRSKLYEELMSIDAAMKNLGIKHMEFIKENNIYNKSKEGW